LTVDSPQGKIAIGNVRISFQRIALGESNGHSLGFLPFNLVREYRDRVPRGWKRGSLFLPIPLGEALWLGFAESGPPTVRVQVGFGEVNAVNGEPWECAPDDASRNYFLCPGRLCLDGVYDPEGRPLRQFALESQIYKPLHIVVHQIERATVYCVSPQLFRSITGREPPRPPETGDVYDGSPLP
jgi:hypothetical protein